MWSLLKRLVARSTSLAAALGDVVFITPREHGILANHSFLEWRVKRSVDGTKFYVSVAMIPDSYIGAEGSPTNYINFDLQAAVRLRENLDGCINYLREQRVASEES